MGYMTFNRSNSGHHLSTYKLLVCISFSLSVKIINNVQQCQWQTDI